MSRRAIGERVGAILKSDKTSVHLLGFGVYDGEHEPPFGPFGQSKAELDATVKEMKAKGSLPADYVYTNPRITLDDGRIVWGAQCWWGSEAAVRKRIEGLTVIPVTDIGGEASAEVQASRTE